MSATQKAASDFGDSSYRGYTQALEYAVTAVPRSQLRGANHMTDLLREIFADGAALYCFPLLIACNLCSRLLRRTKISPQIFSDSTFAEMSDE